jgi:N-acetylglutamate synthase-like GNAT family acetyltransferase
MSDTGTEVRQAEPEDTDALLTLCRQLGYATEGGALPGRLDAILAQPDQGLFVAEQDGTVVGFVHVFARLALEIAPCAQIQALVVAEAARRTGAAQRLVAAVEVWARAHGLTWLSLYCTTGRDAAHGFYPAAGFEAASTATRFNKRLDD